MKKNLLSLGIVLLVAMFSFGLVSAAPPPADVTKLVGRTICLQGQELGAEKNTGFLIVGAHEINKVASREVIFDVSLGASYRGKVVESITYREGPYSSGWELKLYDVEDLVPGPNVFWEKGGIVPVNVTGFK